MQKIMLTLFVTSVLSGCSVFGVYKVDIPQGTPLTKAQAAQVQVGMSFQQVRFLLGSPTISDPLNPQRWTTSTTISQALMQKKQKFLLRMDNIYKFTLMQTVMLNESKV